MIRKMMEILMKWFKRSSVATTENVCVETPVTMEVKNKKSSLLDTLQEYLFTNYDFRFNLLTEQTEYSPKGTTDFKLVDQRALNTLCIEARSQDINCWDKDVSRLLRSQKIADFHPFLTYMANLPEWDGMDRVTELARRVSDTPVWLNGFHRWMLGMTAQWMGMESQCANAVAPLLISTQQGRCKSTFCSHLLPEALQVFYLDKFDINSVSGCEQKLSLFGLVNMDEFDRYNERSQATLKNLMQLRKLTFRKAHRSYYSQLPRIASFIGTSNQKELLTDSTGSRRFLCVEVTDMISEAPIEHKQLYAQLKQEVLNGERDYLNKEEEKEVQRRNKAYYRQSPLEDVFHAYFRHPKADEEGEWLTAAEMFRILSKRNASALRGISAKQLSFRLTAMGFKPRHTDHGNYYQVVRRDAA